MRDSKGRFIKGHKPTWSKESREKVSKTCKERGVGKWMQNRKLSAETRAKIKENNARYWLGKKRPELYKGEDASINRKHKWIEEKMGKAKEHICICCGRQAQDWANKDHSYKRDIDDYMPMCRSCHKKYDLKKKIK